MSESPTVICESCGEKVTSLRRGRCSVCYEQWLHSRPIGMGACCIVCTDRRRENLRLVEFNGAWLPMCHSCAVRAEKIEQLPSSIEGLRQRLQRDRRWKLRRAGARDGRFYPRERRKLERRNNWLTESDWIDAAELIIDESQLDAEALAEVREPTNILKVHPLLVGQNVEDEPAKETDKEADELFDIEEISLEDDAELEFCPPATSEDRATN